MKIKYENGSVSMYDNKHVNVYQTMNPHHNNASIDNEDKAIRWAKEHLMIMFEARPIYFNIECDGEVTVGEECEIKITESTSKLTGEYHIAFKEGDNTIKLPVVFADGEATVKTTFYKEGVYHIDLDQEYMIGQDKYMMLINETERAEARNSENEKFNIVVTAK